MGLPARRLRSLLDSTELHLRNAEVEFNDLAEWLLTPETLEKPIHQVEAEHEELVREMARQLLQAHLNQRGTGDVGPALEVRENEQRLTQKRTHRRKLKTIFGEVTATRTAYYSPGAESVHPLDEQAVLPKRSFSYELQRRVCLGAVQGPFDEALDNVFAATGVRLSKRSAEDLVREAAEDFDAFYEQKEVPSPAESGPILVAAVDRKGIPVVKPEKALRVVRKGKGKRANKKRLSTVATVFSTEPRVRTPEEVVERLFYEGPRLSTTKRRKPEDKRVWASLSKSHKEVIAEVREEVDRRDPDQAKVCALVVDGERGLQQALAKELPRGIEILDLMHALERLWKLAYVFHDEGTEEAKDWVRYRVLRLLKGEISQVIKGIRQSATKRKITGSKREVVDKATGYLYRNRHRMRYGEYLAAGLPIASGSVEGACKNLVKDRFERSGMRWTIETAEALLRLRAAYRSGDFEDYWSFHVVQEQRRIHPDDAWRVVEK